MGGRIKWPCWIASGLMLVALVRVNGSGSGVLLETDWFVVSGSLEGIERVRPLIRPLENWAGEYFGLPARYRPAIRVEWTEREVGTGFSYHVQRRGPEEVELIFANGGGASLESTVLALIEAVFLRKSLASQEEGGASRIPDWLYLSGASAFVESLRPGTYREAPAPEWPGMVEAMRKEVVRPIPEAAFHQGYYLWEFWREVAGGRPAFRRLLLDVRSGRFEAIPWLERYGMPVLGEAELDLGWRTWALATYERWQGPVQSLRRSRLLTENLLEVDLEMEGRLVKASVADLWANRRDAWWDRQRQQRLEWVKRSLPEVNPLYFNALHSIGSVLESMEGDERERFDLGVERLARDLEEADAVYRILIERGY